MGQSEKVLQLSSQKNMTSRSFISLSANHLIKKYKAWFYGKPPSPPYTHIVQIGDPVLRTPASPVPENYFNSDELNSLLRLLKRVKTNYNCVGISAPQIGIPLRVILIELNAEHLATLTPETRKIQDIELVPLTVLINPKLKILDYKSTTSFGEACESVRGYSAHVKRYTHVQCHSVNELGEKQVVNATGWLARVLQHEVDHLNGIMYTDSMDVKTFKCNCWEAVNFYSGKLVIPFSVKSK